MVYDDDIKLRILSPFEVRVEGKVHFDKSITKEIEWNNKDSLILNSGDIIMIYQYDIDKDLFFFLLVEETGEIDIYEKNIYRSICPKGIYFLTHKKYIDQFCIRIEE